MMLEQAEEEIEIEGVETEEYMSEEFLEECVDNDMMSVREASFIAGWKEDGYVCNVEED